MIWRHLLGYLPANIVSGIVSFGSVYAFTRLLGADDYGRYALVATIMFAAHTLTLTWAEAAAFRFAGEADVKGGMADHKRTVMRLSLLSAIPAVLIVFLGWVVTSHDTKMREAIIWLALSMPCFSIIQTSLEIRKATRDVTRFAITSMGYGLLGFTVGILVAWRTDYGAAAPFAGLAAAAIVFAIIEGSSLWRSSKGGQFQTERGWRYFKYGFPVSLALLLEIALTSGDRFLIAHFLDTASVGAYAAGYGVADQTIRLLCMWAAMAGAPLLMQGYEQSGPEGVKAPGIAMARTLLLIACPAAVGLALVAQPLAEFMIGEELRAQAALIIPWIAAAGLLNGLVIYYFSEAFQLSQKTTLRACLMVIPAALNIVLNVVLLPRMGLMGAVYATVICYGVALMLVMSVGRRFAPLPLPLIDLLKVGASCGAMAIGVIQLPAIGGFPELLLKAFVGACIFVILAFILDAAGVRDILRRNTDKFSTPTSNDQLEN